LHLYELRRDLEKYLSSFGDKVPVHTIDELLKSGKYSPSIEENLKEANILSVDSPEYSERLKNIEKLRKDVEAIFEKESLDALIYPHQQQLVCHVGASQLQRNGVLAAVLGLPSIIVPGGFSPPDANAKTGVPVGIEFLGKAFDEACLIEIAYGFEQHSRFRKPPII